MSRKKNGENTSPRATPALVEGVRTPFLRSNGAYTSLMSHDLGRLAVAGLLSKTGVDPKEVDLLTMGTVVFDPRTPNVAREITLGAGLPESTPAFTQPWHVSLAMLQPLMSQTPFSWATSTWYCGNDTLSDPPIRLSKNLRQALVH